MGQGLTFLKERGKSVTVAHLCVTYEPGLWWSLRSETHPPPGCQAGQALPLR